MADDFSDYEFADEEFADEFDDEESAPSEADEEVIDGEPLDDEFADDQTDGDVDEDVTAAGEPIDEAAEADHAEADPSQQEQFGEESFDEEPTTLTAEDSETVVVPESPLEEELDSVRHPDEPASVDVEPLPSIGPAAEPAYVELWHRGERRDTLTLAFDQLVIGRASVEDEDDETEASSPGAPPAAPPAEPAGDVADESPVDDAEEIEEFEAADTDTEQAPVETESEESTQDDGQPEGGVRVAPDIDLSDYGIEEDVWHNHLALHRRNQHHYVHVLADATIQLNDEPLDLGDARELEDGDVIVASEETALVFRAS